MGISVVPSMALSGGSKAGATPGSPTGDQTSMDFSSLLAGQIIDTSLTKQLSIADQLALLGDTSSRGDLQDKLASETSEQSDPLALAGIAFFNNLSPRELKGKDTAQDTLAVADTRGEAKPDDSVIAFGAGAIAASNSMLATASGTDGKSALAARDNGQSLSQATNIDSKITLEVTENAHGKGMLDGSTQTANQTGATTRSLSADLLTSSNEPAKVAGDTAQNAGTNFSSALAAQEKIHGHTAARTDNSHHISVPLNDPRWAQQMGERVVWLARGDAQSAQINITPPQMGPIQININLNGDQMTAHFVAANAEVRQALDEAMPRLREMLSGAGINLGQANVGSQTPQQQQAQAQFGEAPRSTGEEAILSADKHTDSSITRPPVLRGRGLVDLFA